MAEFLQPSHEWEVGNGYAVCNIFYKESYIHMSGNISRQILVVYSLSSIFSIP
jgi:hypothetical protein